MNIQTLNWFGHFIWLLFKLLKAADPDCILDPIQEIDELELSPGRWNELIEFRYAQSISYQNIQNCTPVLVQFVFAGIFLTSNWVNQFLLSPTRLATFLKPHFNLNVACDICIWNRSHYPDPTILRVIIHAWVECFSFWKYPVWRCLNTIWDISLERYMWIWNISNLNTLCIRQIFKVF